MAGELENAVRTLFKSFDTKDEGAVKEYISSEGQGVDEISRRWLRSGDEITEYFGQLLPAVDNVRSDPRDFNEKTWGDTGLVTFWLEQDYTYEGQDVHVSAPTTVVFRREGDDWKIVLLHSIPLPEESQ